jgi:hypothetical protein
LQERDWQQGATVARLLTSGRPLARPSNSPRTYSQGDATSFLSGPPLAHRDLLLARHVTDVEMAHTLPVAEIRGSRGMKAADRA